MSLPRNTPIARFLVGDVGSDIRVEYRRQKLMPPEVSEEREIVGEVIRIDHRLGIHFALLMIKRSGVVSIPGIVYQSATIIERQIDLMILFKERIIDPLRLVFQVALNDGNITRPRHKLEFEMSRDITEGIAVVYITVSTERGPRRICQVIEFLAPGTLNIEEFGGPEGPYDTRVQLDAKNIGNAHTVINRCKSTARKAYFPHITVTDGRVALQIDYEGHLRRGTSPRVAGVTTPLKAHENPVTMIASGMFQGLIYVGHHVPKQGANAGSETGSNTNASAHTKDNIDVDDLLNPDPNVGLGAKTNASAQTKANIDVDDLLNPYSNAGLTNSNTNANTSANTNARATKANIDVHDLLKPYANADANVTVTKVITKANTMANMNMRANTNANAKANVNTNATTNNVIANAKLTNKRAGTMANMNMRANTNANVSAITTANTTATTTATTNANATTNNVIANAKMTNTKPNTMANMNMNANANANASANTNSNMNANANANTSSKAKATCTYINARVINAKRKANSNINTNVNAKRHANTSTKNKADTAIATTEPAEDPNSPDTKL